MSSDDNFTKKVETTNRIIKTYSMGNKNSYWFGLVDDSTNFGYLTLIFGNSDIKLPHLWVKKDYLVMLVEFLNKFLIDSSLGG